MGLGLFVMGIIILITLIVVGAVLYYGIQEDPHTEIRETDESDAVKTLSAQAEAAARKLQALGDGSSGASSQEAAGESGGKQEGDSLGLGDEETKRKRREAALARKAARQGNKPQESGSSA